MFDLTPLYILIYIFVGSLVAAYVALYIVIYKFLRKRGVEEEWAHTLALLATLQASKDWWDSERPYKRWE